MYTFNPETYFFTFKFTKLFCLWTKADRVRFYVTSVDISLYVHMHAYTIS